MENGSSHAQVRESSSGCQVKHWVGEGLIPCGKPSSVRLSFGPVCDDCRKLVAKDMPATLFRRIGGGL